MIPISDYKNPFGKKLLLYISCFFSILSILFIFVAGSEEESAIVFGGIILIPSIYGIIKNGWFAYRIRKSLAASNIDEIWDDESGTFWPLLIIQKNNLLGLFDTKTMKIVSNPTYLEIAKGGKFLGQEFLRLENTEGKFGVFNCDLKKVVVPCEYEYTDFSRDSYLRLAKESTIYKFSFFGELLDQHYYGEELDRLVDGLSAEQLACLAQKKDY